MVYKDLWVVSYPWRTAGPNIVGSCCIRLQTTANTHATTPNSATMLGGCCIRLQTTANTHATTPNSATMLGVVASVCTQPKTSNFLPVQPQNRAKSFSYIFRCCLPFKNLHGPAGSVQVPLRLNEKWIRASLCRCPFKNLSTPVNGV